MSSLVNEIVYKVLSCESDNPGHGMPAITDFAKDRVTFLLRENPELKLIRKALEFERQFLPSHGTHAEERINHIEGALRALERLTEF